MEKVLVIFCQFTDVSFNPKTQHNTMRKSKYGKKTCEKLIWKIPSYYHRTLGSIFTDFFI